MNGKLARHLDVSTQASVRSVTSKNTHLRPVLAVERLDVGEIVLGPPGTAGPICPAKPHIAIFVHEAHDAIESVEAGATGTDADLPKKARLPCCFAHSVTGVSVEMPTSTLWQSALVPVQSALKY